MPAVRVDTSSWLSGAVLVGDEGFGVLGSQIASLGDAGPGYAYNDLALPGDANKEICGRITSWPSAGTLTAYEDTSFSFVGAPDGTYSFEYQLYVDGVATGSPTSVILTIGDGTHAATGTLLAGSSGVSGASARFHVFGSTADLAASAATLSGVAARFMSHVSTGNIAAAESVIAAAGVRFRVHDSAGDLVSPSSQISGSSVTFTQGSGYGDLLAGTASVTGTAARLALHTCDIALSAGSATVSGSCALYAAGAGVLSAGDISAIANAVWAHLSAVDLTTKVGIAEAILRNKTVTDPATGLMTVYASDGITPLLTAQLYEGVTADQAYRGQGAERRERLS